MSNLLLKIFSNLSTRIMFIFYVSFILVTVFFIVFGYLTQFDLQKERQYDELSGIVSSTAISIDGDAHQQMMKKYQDKYGITANDQNLTYQKVHYSPVEVCDGGDIERDKSLCRFQIWKGDFEQVDEVCVISVRV